MTSKLSFLTANALNPKLIESHCPSCGLLIAASPRSEVLRILERIHSCPVYFKYPKRTGVACPFQNRTVARNESERLRAWQENKAGQALFTPAGTHLPENIGDKDLNAILVELKTPKAASAAKK